MFKGNVQNSPCIAPNSTIKAHLLSSKFLDADIEAGKLWQAWTVPCGDLRTHTSNVDAFNGIANFFELASRRHDSPQRAEWIGEDNYAIAQSCGSLCNSHFSAEPVYTPAFSLPETRKEFAYGLNGLINGLPDELLCHVFRFLPTSRDRSACASVSKRWLSLQSHMCHDEFAYMHVEAGFDEAGDEVQSREVISNGRSYQSSANEKRINRQPQWALGDLSRSLEGRKASDTRLAAVAVGTGARGGLGKLSLRQSIATDAGLSAIGYCCSALKSLCLWDCPNIEDKGFLIIGKGCRLLEKVDLFKCPLVGDVGLQSIAKNCSLLSFLSLDECASVTDKALIAVGGGCPNLLSLSVRSCSLIGDEGLVSAICNLKRLKRMKLDGLKVGDKTLACIGLYAKALVRLSLSNLEVMTEEGFVSFSSAQGMQFLQRFSVTSCKSFGDSAFAMMGKMRQGLKSISLVRCNRVSDVGLSLFMQNAASLEDLKLEMCNSITARGFIQVFLNKNGNLREVCVKSCDGIVEVGVFAFPFFSNFSTVKSISITHCSKVDNVLLALIGCLCPHATSIDFSGLTGISDEGILAFLFSGRRQLASVNLNGCSNITDRSVCAIAEQCGESLKILCLDGCKKLTDKGLKSVAKHCIVLEDLDVSQCRFTDEGVNALLHESGPTLSSLSLSSCRDITDRILPVIEKCCYGLSDLNLKHCQGLSQKSIYSFEARLWKCNVLSV